MLFVLFEVFVLLLFDVIFDVTDAGFWAFVMLADDLFSTEEDDTKENEVPKDAPTLQRKDTPSPFADEAGGATVEEEAKPEAEKAEAPKEEPEKEEDKPGPGLRGLYEKKVDPYNPLSASQLSTM